MCRQREGSVVSALKMARRIEQGVPKRLSAHVSREIPAVKRGNANGNSVNVAYQSGVDAFSMDLGAFSAGEALEEELIRGSEDCFPSSSAQLDDFEARLIENSAVSGPTADREGLFSGSSVSSSSGVRMGRFTRPLNTVRSSIQRQAIRHADLMSINERAAVAPVAAPFLSRAKPSLLSQNSCRISGQRVVSTRRVEEGEARGVLTSSASRIVKEAVSEEEMERQIEAELDIKSVRALPNRGDSDSDDDY